VPGDIGSSCCSRSVPLGGPGLTEVVLKILCQARCPGQPLVRPLRALQRAQKQVHVAVLHLLRRRLDRHCMLSILRLPPSEAILSPRAPGTSAPACFRGVLWATPHPLATPVDAQSRTKHAPKGLFRGGNRHHTGTRSGTPACADSAPYSHPSFSERAGRSISMGVASRHCLML
jgi:hypothetical protein